VLVGTEEEEGQEMTFQRKKGEMDEEGEGERERGREGKREKRKEGNDRKEFPILSHHHLQLLKSCALGVCWRSIATRVKGAVISTIRTILVRGYDCEAAIRFSHEHCTTGIDFARVIPRSPLPRVGSTSDRM